MDRIMASFALLLLAAGVQANDVGGNAELQGFLHNKFIAPSLNHMKTGNQMEDGTFMIVDDKPDHQTAQSQNSLPLFAMGISMLSFAAVLGARLWRGMQPATATAATPAENVLEFGGQNGAPKAHGWMQPSSENSRQLTACYAGGESLYGAPRPVQIIPSVLPADFAALGLDCTALEKAGCHRIQFDVMDGNFVPNLTFGPDVIAAQRKTTSLPFETQLMVSERCTDAMLEQFTECTKGPNGEPGVVIVHVEACTHIHRSLSNIRAMGGSPSVALNPSTPAEAVENVLDLVDHVLVMTVNPGFGGQAYIPTMTDKIRKIRKWIVDRGLDVDIEVDGGIKATPETIGACAQAGANCFIAGSGLFAYDDMSQGVKELTAIAEEYQKK